jgi:Phage ABA sandwich domain
MEPGRELDALIAEKIMGLDHVRYQNQGWHRDLVHGSDIIAGVSHIVPWYSLSVGDAWEVVHKLRCTLKGCFFLRWDRISDMWAAGFDGNVGSIEIQSESAAHAICLAALELIGHSDILKEDDECH